VELNRILRVGGRVIGDLRWAELHNDYFRILGEVIFRIDEVRIGEVERYSSSDFLIRMMLKAFEDDISIYKGGGDDGIVDGGNNMELDLGDGDKVDSDEILEYRLNKEFIEFKKIFGLFLVGLISESDWIASNIEFFSYWGVNILQGFLEDKEVFFFRDYYEWACKRTESVVDKDLLLNYGFESKEAVDLSFRRIFGLDPRPLQSVVEMKMVFFFA